MEGSRVVSGKHISMKIHFIDHIFGLHASMKGNNVWTLFFPG